MENRTAEIIMVCKGQHDLGELPTLKQSVIAYMSDRCICPVEAYTDDRINEIIWTAALDYTDGMKDTPPSVFWREVKRAMDIHNNPLVRNINRIDAHEAMCIAFMLAQVMEDDRYIDGFTEENTRHVFRENAGWLKDHGLETLFESDFLGRPVDFEPILDDTCVSIEFHLSFDANKRWKLGTKIVPDSYFTFVVNWDVAREAVDSTTVIYHAYDDYCPLEPTELQIPDGDIQVALAAAGLFCLSEHGCGLQEYAKSLVAELQED